MLLESAVISGPAANFIPQLLHSAYVLLYGVGGAGGSLSMQDAEGGGDLTTSQVERSDHV